jgi:hypothetical protein
MSNKMNITNPAAIDALARSDMENFLAAATPGGIEAQEKRGQTSFVASSTLPNNCPRKELETLGFVFGTDVDDLFISVTFPQGWRKVASDHSMWSTLIDDKGRIRAGIFYKAAFYDRKAHMRLDARYTYTNEYPDDGDVAAHVVDGSTATHLFSITGIGRSDWSGQDAANKQCREWLDKHFPDWANPLAYWD